MKLFAGWARSGIPWQTAPGLVLLTAAALLCTAVAAWRGRGQVAALAGGTGLTIGVMVTLGYVTGTPLHYNASVVPMASTSVAMVEPVLMN